MYVPVPNTRPVTSLAPTRCPSPSCAAICGPCPRTRRSSPTAAAPTASMPTTQCVSSTGRASWPEDWLTGFPNGNEPACPSRPGTETIPMADELVVDPEALREQVREKYREVAAEQNRAFH